jgi:DNA-binding NarL/FixJ family response regulator
MPPTNTDEGLRAAKVIADEFPHVGVLVLSSHIEEEYARELLENGATGVGYMLKDRVAEVGRVHRGGAPDRGGRGRGSTRR